MYYHYMNAIAIIIVIFIILMFKKRKKPLWVVLFCLSLLPFIAMASGAIYSFFNGTGLVGDTGDVDSALFAIVAMFILQWYIYIPALVLLGISIYNIFVKKN